MTPYLLTWNPRRWPWDELAGDLQDFATDNYIDTRWSCGVTTTIAEGDRAFLIRLGEEPRGIVASGTVQPHDLFENVGAVRPMSDVYEAPHWSGEPGRMALYVNVRFDTLLDPEVAVFPLDRLDALNQGLPPGVKPQVWRSRSSGIRIIDEIVADLELQWGDFLSDGGEVATTDLDEEGREHARRLQRRGGGEGTPHLRLKQYIAENPRLLGLPADVPGRQEHMFPSGDECDVVFDLPDGSSAVVEVKNGERGELVKGIYQAVKYRALLAAERGRGGAHPVRAYLVAYQIPADISEYAADFGIECRRVERSRIEALVP